MEERDEFRLIFEFLWEQRTEVAGRKADSLCEDNLALLRTFADGTLNKASHPSVIALLSENPTALKYLADLLRAIEDAESSPDQATPS